MNPTATALVIRIAPRPHLFAPSLHVAAVPDVLFDNLPCFFENFLVQILGYSVMKDLLLSSPVFL